MQKGASTVWVLIGAILLVLYFSNFFAPYGFPAPQLGATTAPPSGGQPVQMGPGYATIISVSAINAITGASITDANAWIYASDGSWAVTDVAVSSATTQVSNTSPNSLVGFAMIGNDQNQGTDRGTEWYYTKIPINYQNKGVVMISSDASAKVKLYPETTSITWTGYDDGVAENPLNVSVGTSVVSSTELKIQVASSSAFGNPELSNPVGVCFNVSDPAKFDDIRPTNYIGTFPVPEFLKGRNVIGCYILPTEALVDDGVHQTFYRFYITIDPATDLGVSDYAYAFAMDKTYYLDDNQVWQIGWGDDSARGTDYDPGFQAIGNEKLIAFS